MVKCPNCGADAPKSLKNWKYGAFDVNMYKCDCGNKFREYFHEGKLRFVLSTHNGSLPMAGRQLRQRKESKK